MIYFWLDANAIVKRYVTEKGTSIINHFYTNISHERMICLFDSMDEARFAIIRKKNDGKITPSEFNQAIQKLEREVVNSAKVLKEHATVHQKEAARQLMHRYPINSTDAYIFRCALDKANQLRITGDDLILISSDKDLLKAAKKERLHTFDPETDSQTALDILINSP